MYIYLKNRRKEEALNGLTDNQFSKALGPAYESAASQRTLGPDDRIVVRTEGLAVMLRAAEIGTAPECITNGWNDWPAVTPPEGVLLAVEYRQIDDWGMLTGIYRDVWEWSFNCFASKLCPNGISVVDTKRLREVRFRLWDAL